MQELVQQVKAALPASLPARLGVAVSGGGDSVALLSLLECLTANSGCELSCATVNHGLRPEAREEASWVADLCGQMAVSHKTLEWHGWDGVGNTQNNARKARYALISEWALQNGIGTIALGHTQDDQAETVLMRLARGGGVDGLSAMSPERLQNGISWVRPLLEISRADLRHYLLHQGIGWHDDPSNEDENFDRIKARKTLDQLKPLGIDSAVLAKVANNMRSARAALESQTLAAAKEVATVRAGAVIFDWDALDALTSEIKRRLVLTAVRWIAGSAYAPRSRSVSAAMSALIDSGSATLDGCHFARVGKQLWIFREFNAVRREDVSAGMLWDDRWILSGDSDPEDLRISALGQNGLLSCKNWRQTGLPRALLLASPAVWKGDMLCAAPHAGMRNGWQAILKYGDRSFFDAVFSH